MKERLTSPDSRKCIYDNPHVAAVRLSHVYSLVRGSSNEAEELRTRLRSVHDALKEDKSVPDDVQSFLTRFDAIKGEGEEIDAMRLQLIKDTLDPQRARTRRSFLKGVAAGVIGVEAIRLGVDHLNRDSPEKIDPELERIKTLEATLEAAETKFLTWFQSDEGQVAWQEGNVELLFRQAGYYRGVDVKKTT